MQAEGKHGLLSPHREQPLPASRGNLHPFPDGVVDRSVELAGALTGDMSIPVCKSTSSTLFSEMP